MRRCAVRYVPVMQAVAVSRPNLSLPTAIAVVLLVTTAAALLVLGTRVEVSAEQDLWITCTEGIGIPPAAQVTVQGGQRVLLNSHSQGHSFVTRMLVDYEAEVCVDAKGDRQTLGAVVAADGLLLTAGAFTKRRAARLAIAALVSLLSAFAIFASLARVPTGPALTLAAVAVPMGLGLRRANAPSLRRRGSTDS